MPTIQEPGRSNHKGPWNVQNLMVETNTLKIGISKMVVAKERKMVWIRLWNPIEGVCKGVATTYFHDNYQGRRSMESQMNLEWPKPTDGIKYTQKWYSNNDCDQR
jgi:hypothetical protein